MFARRSFLIGCGGMAAAPAIAQLKLPVAAGLSASLPAPVLPGPAAVSGVADPADWTLRIAGWDMPGSSGHAAPGEVWLHINSSWRAAWR